MMKEKVQSAVAMIKLGLANSAKPVIAWSGGKDSMALLDLVYNQAGVKVPVVFYREQWQPHKYAFQNRIIEQWGLEVYTWHPTRTAFAQTDDEFEVQNQYIFDNTDMTCPTGITPVEEGKPWVCAMDIYNRPKNTGIVAGWDVMFVGHKHCDTDKVYGGDAGCRVDVRINPGQCDAYYPIKDWSHDDVFQYCEEYGVPIQMDRYEEVEGKWGEREDRTTNCDYVHACTACIDRRPEAKKFIHCPKLGCTIENISSRVEWANQELPTFMQD